MGSGMDVPLTPARRVPWRVVAAVGIAAAVLLGIALRGRTSTIAVERVNIVTARVERGTLLREANGTGTLVAARSRVITAETTGRVESILVQAGQRTDSATPIVLLSNAEAEEQAVDAKASLDYAQADLIAARAQVEQSLLALRAENARLDGEAVEAAAHAHRLAQLAALELTSAAELNVANVRAASLKERVTLARDGLRAAESAVDAQLATRRATIAQTQARYGIRRRAVDSLTVRALINGIVQEVFVEPGQRVMPGENIARVADSSVLLARIHVPPVQARDIIPGLDVRIDIHAGVVRGRVSRVDPAVRDGSVTVDVMLLDALPAGVRPDSRIEATIVLGRLDNALLVRRPANVADGSVVELFRVGDGSSAGRTTVSLGRGSAAAVEVLHGLEAGDVVIVSDTSPWQDYDRIRIR